MKISARLFLFGLAGFLALPSPTYAALPAGFEMETIAEGLTLPTAMAFAPDGRIFVAQKNGIIRIIKNGALLPTPLLSLSDVNSYGDRGLIGMAVDPNFSSNGYLYLSYTYENTPGANITGAKTGRIVRITVTGDTADESSKVVLVGTVPGNAAAPSCDDIAVTADCIPSDSSSHSVGGLAFGPDGKLYASLGDGAHFDYKDSRAMRAQNLDSLAGKILRINKDGTAPADNPFYNGSPTANRSKVYAYGVRNSFRFTFHPTTGILYAGDVGWSTWEEANKVTRGANHGWPCREGMFENVPYGCTVSNRVDPLYVYQHDQSGAGSITMGSFPKGNAYPASYANTIIFGDYAQNWIKALNLTATGAFISVTEFASGADGADGPVAFLTGPDGNVYYIAIYTGAVKRISYTAGNRQPIGKIAANPTSGLTPLTVNFSSSGSLDPDGDPLTFLWNFGDNTTSTLANPSKTYSVAGTYTAVLQVSDNKGGKSVVSMTIVAGNQKPKATISAPASGLLYKVGDTITVSGNATDPEDGTLAGSRLAWRVILHHNTHTHVLETRTGNSFQITAPDHGDPDVYTEIELVATDSAGLTDKKSVNIYLDNGASADGNLVQNPSFEDIDPLNSARPQKWESNFWGVNNAVFSYPVPGFDGESQRGAKVVMTAYTSGDAKWMPDLSFVADNTQYKFSNYYKSTVETELVAEIELEDATYEYLFLAALPASSTWKKTEATFTTPANARSARVFHVINKVGELNVDTYVMQAVTAPPPPPPPPPNSNLIANPSLETSNGGGNAPVNWLNNGWGTNTATFAYPVAGQDGAKAGKVTMTAHTTGDAKWYFADVPVTPDTQYTFSNYYQSTAVTHLVARYTSTTGALSYVTLLSSVPVSASWKQQTAMFTPPAGTASVTVFHVIAAVGSLTVDNYSLTTGGTTPPPPPPPPPPDPTTNLIQNPSLATSAGSSPASWNKNFWGGVGTPTFTYPVAGSSDAFAAKVTISSVTAGGGDAKWYFDNVVVTPGKKYRFSNKSIGTAETHLVARYTSTSGVDSYVYLSSVPTSSTYRTNTVEFVVPAGTASMTVFHVLSVAGSLTVDDYSLVIVP